VDVKSGYVRGHHDLRVELSRKLGPCFLHFDPQVFGKLVEELRDKAISML